MLKEVLPKWELKYKNSIIKSIYSIHLWLVSLNSSFNDLFIVLPENCITKFTMNNLTQYQQSTQRVMNIVQK